jgi:membrane protein implicated in regulation of membrane protease activity
MEIILGVASIILFILITLVPAVFLTEIVNNVKWYDIVASGIISVVLLIATVATVEKLTEINKPKAIDVYRGKTTLEITYIDSIPQDTVVVFKRKD